MRNMADMEKRLSMIYVSVMANDSLLADAITEILSAEIGVDVSRLTRYELGKGDRYSVVISVDEEGSESETINLNDLVQDGMTLLVILISLKSRDIYIYESHQMKNPEIERIIHLVREFGSANLNKKD
jgi:hypothetical protein